MRTAGRNSSGLLERGSSVVDTSVLTLKKGLRILEAVSEHTKGVTLTELAHELGTNKSTLHRFLTTFHEVGYLERVEGTDRYRLGVRVLKLAGAILDGQPIREVASPVLNELMLKTGETSHLCMLDGSDVVYLDKVDSPHALRMYSYVGLRLPVHSTAAGKAMLAYLPETDLRRILAAGLPPRTGRTITSEAALRDALVSVRTRGYATDDEETSEGIRCVAAPVFDYDRRVVAAVSVSAPTGRLPSVRAGEIAPTVMDAAQQISARLGYRIEVRPASVARG